MSQSNQEKQEHDDEEDQSLSPWSQLLPELLSRVSLHVFRGGDVGALSLIPSVCKSWNNLFDINHSVSLIRTTLSDPPLNALPPEYPCLMTLRGTSCKFYHPSHVFTMDFPQLFGFYIQFSKFGWLLLCSIRSSDDNSYTYFFFNPFTRQKIDLPACDEGFYGMSFSSPPTSSDCFVVGITWFNTFGITKRGEEKWIFYESVNIGRFKPYSHLTICGDCCYAIGNESKILVFNLKRNSIYLIGNSLHKESSPIYIKAGFLVEDGAQLLAVMVPREEQNIYIRRMTHLKQKWLHVEILRNKMLFVSKTASMLKPAPIKAASNKIYFPKVFNDDTLIPYCLATRKYISLFGDNDYAKKSPWNANMNVKQWSNCTWIETMQFAPFACNHHIDW